MINFIKRVIIDLIKLESILCVIAVLFTFDSQITTSPIQFKSIIISYTPIIIIFTLILNLTNYLYKEE